ncbi:AAA family ATPase [Streptomyces chromofuscus]|uniref:AAA family ATPase n=1 Tax=Streptomyces chromofuscus TaxID=42881 RepID=UPI001676293E|nr:LuxR family transcriptional regulator [Streptomyces chromofuscus]GGT38315.1 helix-turn-helix transcriptional regulator [Streptomyces chromofuscus]
MGDRPEVSRGAPGLLGRSGETAALRNLVVRACAGSGGALVLHGEGGIGKTTLLDSVHTEYRTLRVLRVENAQTETELSFAGLQHLTSPILRHFGGLPQPQRDALGVALGRRAGPAPDPLHLGLAVLNLLSAAAEERPVVCLVDDAQWMDRSSLAVLAFVARRVAAQRVAFVFAAEGIGRLGELTGLPARAVGPLGDRDARELLDSTVRAPLDPRVRERVLTEAHGNPLALLHLPRWIGPTEMAARSAGGDRGGPKRLEESFRIRLSQLPTDTRLLLLLAAAEPDGNPLVVRRAAARLDIGPDAAAVAEAAGILDTGTRMSFRHPLLRSMVYAAASSTERRRAHATLAECCDAVQEPDRHAWHLGQAAAGFDEDVAGRLEDAARRAARGAGPAVACGFWELAAALTVDRRTRASRLLSAACAKRETGAFREALAMLASLRHEPMPDADHARVALLHARTVYAVQRDEEAVRLLVDAARLVADEDPVSARHVLLDAFAAVAYSGRHLPRERIADLVAETRRICPDLAVTSDLSPDTDGSADAESADGLVGLVLRAQIAAVSKGPVAAAPLMARAVRTSLADARAEALDDPNVARLAGDAALHVGDARAWQRLVDRQVQSARERRDHAALPIALNQQAMVDLHFGRLDDAAERVAEAHGITDTLGMAPLRYADLALAAWRGDEQTGVPLIDLAAREAAERREGRLLTATEYARAVLHNGAGRPESALAAVGERYDSAGAGYRALLAAECAEAAVACGQTPSARSAREVLRENARACGTPWAEGLYLQTEALLQDGWEKEESYRRAVEELTRAGAVLQAARAHLLWGEWLLKTGRRTRARQPLRQAWTVFSGAGALAFRTRAAAKLGAVGERSVRPSRGVHTLTAQELRVARMVASGETSREIGAALFVSPRTVDAHVRSILRKLDVLSRRQLRHVEGLRPAERSEV